VFDNVLLSARGRPMREGLEFLPGAAPQFIWPLVDQHGADRMLLGGLGV